MDQHIRTNEGENGTYKVGEVADDARNQRERSVSVSFSHSHCSGDNRVSAS